MKIILQVHKLRRKYQKKYHTDIMVCLLVSRLVLATCLQNSQYTYYGAGLLSEHDRFPEHQRFVREQYGYGMTATRAAEEEDEEDGMRRRSVRSFESGAF